MSDADETQALAARLRSSEARLREVSERLARRDAEVRNAEKRARLVQERLDKTKADLAEQKARAAEARHQLATLRASRWHRIGAAFRAALRNPLLLPLALLKALRPKAVKAPAARPHVEIPPQPGPAPVRRLRVAAILDEFSTAAFAPDCDLIPFTPDGWLRDFTDRAPHLLLVESAWLGNEGRWRYQIGEYAASQGQAALRAVLDWCHSNDVPTVFWNKEDPVHFDRYASTAALFDHVFTTDERMVERYLALEGFTGTAQALPFAAQPAIHNPVALSEGREARACFAGTYYKTRDRERLEQLEALLDGARDFGLVIYDRTFGQDSEKFGYPDRFEPFIKGYLPYDEMVRAYKRFRVFLNGSSVADSPTMVSRRVFEILASGTALVTAPNAAVQSFFGDLVPQVSTEPDAKAVLDRLLHDDEHWRSITRAGLRAVLSEHTYRHRLATIAATAGLEVDLRADQRLAALSLRAGAGATRLGVEPDEVVVADASGAPEHDQVRMLAPSTAAPWVTLADRTHDVDSALLATAFARADVIGNASTPSAEHRYDPSIDLSTAIVRREVVAARGWPGSVEELRAWAGEGVRVYACG